MDFGFGEDQELLRATTRRFLTEHQSLAEVRLSLEEPEIFNAIRFGSILENVVYNPADRKPDYDDVSITENTRCAYPIEFIPNIVPGSMGLLQNCFSSRGSASDLMASSRIASSPVRAAFVAAVRSFIGVSPAFQVGLFSLS